MFSKYLLYDILAVAATLIVTLITYILWSHQYWKKRNVPHSPPKFPFGNMEPPLRRTKHLSQVIDEEYKQHKTQGQRFFGFYSLVKPQLVLIDPELVKNVMSKDFQNFMDRGVFYNEKSDPLSAHLFSIGGNKWRNLRAKLTPTFTTGKMKIMLQTLVECSGQLEEAVQNWQNLHGAVEIKECVARFTTDIIGSVAFGLDCNSFKDEDANFRKYGKKLFTSSKTRLVRITFNQIFPNISKLIGNRVFPKEITDFFMNAVKTTVDYRETNNFQRKDFLQILIDLKNKEGEKDGLTIEEIAAQSFVFFIAGFETSSTAMTFSMFEMCKNLEIQGKAREEVLRVLKKHDGKITYEALMEMTYLGNVLDEALRKYPPLPVLTRRCTQDYKIPGTDVILEKNRQVLIPVYSLHYDEDLYPEPEKFDPERFNDENKSNINQFAYLPFGEGPRICIGLRFGVMQAKVGLAVLLKNFKFKLSEKTKLPLRIDPKVFIMQTVDTIYLDAEKL